ncbi:MAG: FGGY family carbohydrate kinase, partial [Planctomycetota bacterium]
MDRAVGIDFGTSGARACVLDAGGRPVAEAAIPLRAPLQTADGGWEQDPELWWTALRALLGELARRVDLGSLRALAIDGTSGTLVACSQEGRPLHPALMYHDARARDEAARIKAVAPRESGGHGATSSLAKLLWLKGRGFPGSARVLASHPSGIHAGSPACAGRGAWLVLHQAEWVAGRLLGRFDLGDENNLLKLGYDVLERRWPDWLGALGIDPGCLPL